MLRGVCGGSWNGKLSGFLGEAGVCGAVDMGFGVELLGPLCGPSRHEAAPTVDREGCGFYVRHGLVWGADILRVGNVWT